MADDLTPEDNAMLNRAMSHFHMATAMYRMGLGEQLPPHPVSDKQYQQALADAERMEGKMWKDVPHDLQHALDRLHYSDPRKILYESLSLFGVVEGGGKLLVVGDPDNGAYEWVHVDADGKLQRHSDDGYGIAEVALRDGLCALMGLPGT